MSIAPDKQPVHNYNRITLQFESNETDCKCLKLTELGEKQNISHCDCIECVRVHRQDNTETLYASQQTAKDFCHNLSSVLRWYTNHDDICPLGDGQHWTSGYRTVHEYEVQLNDVPSSLDPLTCFRVIDKNYEGTNYVECGDSFPFFCKIGDNMYKDVTSPNNDGSTDKSNNTAGVIGGTLSAILIIVIAAVVGIVLYKRRKISKEPPTRTIRGEDRPKNVNAHTNKTNSNGQYHEIDVKTIDYSLPKPLSNNKELIKTEEDTDVYTRIVSSAFGIQNEASKTNNTISNPGYNDMNTKDRNNQDNNVNNKRKNPEIDIMAVSDYDLAKPISDMEELDPYTANTDYDHLNNVKKHEMRDIKVYDHLKNATESDPTYDHTGVTVSEDTENYEHFNVEK
ncbi:unnamed protein product [Mytilus coruscus]|uniref:C-type lectin domain-containing protein n=1 Tax=Mytilus coruscus TaxID=42192 RepID=A0A6J8ANM8_MYTCO|nr:unnamed protein product [Mytilus coruscus]